MFDAVKNADDMRSRVKTVAATFSIFLAVVGVLVFQGCGASESYSITIKFPVSASPTYTYKDAIKTLKLYSLIAVSVDSGCANFIKGASKPWDNGYPVEDEVAIFYPFNETQGLINVFKKDTRARLFAVQGENADGAAVLRGCYEVRPGDGNHHITIPLAMVCLSDRSDCDSIPANGCEADLTTAAYCGACEIACTTGPVSGNGHAACINGQCAIACDPAFARCAGDCVAEDMNHCGSACVVCSPIAADVCTEGVCRCGGNPACGDVTPSCVDHACIDYCASALCWKIPPTGQSSCYNDSEVLSTCPGVADGSDCADTPFCGQDAQYLHTTRTLSIVTSAGSENIVADDLNGLRWQQGYGLGTMFSGAATACDSLSYAGFEDWRLPNHLELASLVDYAAVTEPTIDRTAFPDTPTDVGYWTSSLATTGWAIWVHFKESAVFTGALGYTERTRCVRGVVPAELADARRFLTLSDSQSVLDRATGLIWQKEHTAGLDWKDALAYCQHLDAGQQHEWRLPNVQELHSLIEHDYFNPATSFPDMLGDGYENGGYWFWTSTTAAMIPDAAWCVGFYDGSIAGAKTKTETNLRFTRCVRGGP